MGAADIGAAILDAAASVKRANPAAKYCCDPVIGDVGRGIFVSEGIPEFMAGFVPAISFRGRDFPLTPSLLQRPISPISEVAHCRIRPKSMMRLNRR